MTIPDTPASVALNPSAPAAERYDAQIAAHLGIGHMVSPGEMAPIVNYIKEQFEDQAAKSMSDYALINPSKNHGKPGPQSVLVDDMQIALQGRYWDRPGILGFDAMRAMVEQTPILNSIVLTRVRQVHRFCRVQASRAESGFIIAHVDKNQELNDEQRQSVQLLQHFITNCGWEMSPIERKRMKRDNFSSFICKVVRDSLTMDACAIETEYKRDSRLGLDGFYAVDGGTIRLCTEDGYNGDDEIYAVQVIQGNIRNTYTYEELVYETRNPRTDVTASGYGYGEPEMLIRVITYLLNAMTYNGNFFDKNSIPKGILSLAGDYAPEDLAAFKRYANAMVRGVQNSHNFLTMVAKDSDSKATFEKFDEGTNEMAYAKWLSFLTSVSCAIYGIAPEEVSMESFAAQKSGLAGSDTEEKITSSSDKGLRPLLGFLENTISDFIIRPFSSQYVHRFVGIDGDDEQQRFEARKLCLSVDEFRQLEGFDPWGDKTGIGDAPINPTLLGAWQAAQAQPGGEEDFGQLPGEEAAPGAQAAGGGRPKSRDNPAAKPVATKPDPKQRAGEDIAKALGLPDLHIYGLDR